MAQGVDYCGPVNTTHIGFLLDTLEKFMKDWTLGSYLVMKITPRVTSGIPRMIIGYKYNSRKVLGFVATEVGISTETGDTCLSHLTDIFLMFLFASLLVLTCQAGISMPVMEYKITI